MFDSSGKKISKKTTKRMTHLVHHILDDAISSSLSARENSETTSIPVELSLHDYLQQQAGKMARDDNERALLIDVGESFGPYLGEPFGRQSLKFAWLEGSCGGGENTLIAIKIPGLHS